MDLLSASLGGMVAGFILGVMVAAPLFQHGYRGAWCQLTPLIGGSALGLIVFVDVHLTTILPMDRRDRERRLRRNRF